MDTKSSYICDQRKSQQGYALLSVIIVTALGLSISFSMLEWASGTLRTRQVIERNTENFYSVEAAINSATAWLQANSKSLVTAFNATNFPNNFDLGSPTAGTNQGSNFVIPTLVKMKSSTNSVQLTNSSYFGTSSFPATTHIDSGVSFDAVAQFAAQDFGTNVNIRILLVWAQLTNGSYQPVFRVDAITGSSDPDKGVHGINFIQSNLVTADSGGVGYYADTGEFDTNTPNNICMSYQYSWNSGTSSWSRGAARSNCLITGQDDIDLVGAVYGNVKTNKVNGITLSGGASISGTQCEGLGCVTYTLPSISDWATRCSGVSPVDLNITAGVTHNLTSGAGLSSQCYRDIDVRSNGTLVFATVNQPYHIRNLILRNNSNSVMRFTTTGPGNKYTIYVDNLNDGSINGNQFVSTNLAPHQVEIYNALASTLRLNGTASMHGVLYGGMGFRIVHQGNFTFYGAFRTDEIDITGNAVLGYDEELGVAVPVLSDVHFTLFKASQRYR